MASASYNPKDYWIEQGKVYKDNFRYNSKFELQERFLIEYLTSNVFPTTNSDGNSVKLSVLEVGCGFGRITRLILKNFDKLITRYTAVDISPDQISNAKKFVGDPPLGRHDVPTGEVNESKNEEGLEFVVSDIQTLTSTYVSNMKYDLVLACEVLLHVLPSEIDQVVYQLTEMSNKHIINIDWYEAQVPKKIAPHNFIHQYEKIYANISTVKRIRKVPIIKKGLISKLDTKQSIFHASKEAD